MNREIFFRGRSLSDGGWVYGDLEYERNKGLLSKVRIHTYKEDGKYDRQYLVESDTVGQFTGLYDKNGVEIYEGDVVKTQFSKLPLGYIVWHNEGYFCSCPNQEMFENGESFTPLGRLMKHHINGEKVEIEVIGNIHDNFDLL